MFRRNQRYIWHHSLLSAVHRLLAADNAVAYPLARAKLPVDKNHSSPARSDIKKWNAVKCFFGAGLFFHLLIGFLAVCSRISARTRNNIRLLGSVAQPTIIGSPALSFIRPLSTPVIPADW